MPTTLDFLAERITIGLDPVNGCWIWTGQLNDKGYARDTWHGRKEFIHRIIFELVTGQPVPAGFVLDHLCRVHECVNPRHLEVVTNAENIRRGLIPLANREFCTSGRHDLSEVRVITDSDGKRRCHPCRLDSQRAARARRLLAAAA